MELKRLLDKVKKLNKSKEYEKSILLLPDDLLSTYNNSDLFALKAESCYRIDNIIKCQEYVDKALIINANNPIALFYQGTLFYKANEIDKAIECYTKAIAFDIKYAYPYNGLGNTYKELKDNDKATDAYNKAIELDPKYDFPYYNLGLIYKYKENHEDQAINFFNEFIAIAQDSNNAYTKYAKNHIEELKKKLDDQYYQKISNLINKIKQLLLYNAACITHYTSLSVARRLILEASPLRISEGAFLNDTSEGSALFDFVEYDIDKATHNKNTPASLQFLQKPFIGSYVSDSKYNDLTLWRMYGKENNEEAKGCAITLDAKKLVESIKGNLLPKDRDNLLDEEFQLFKVAYLLKKDYETGAFIIPDATKDDEDELNKCVLEIKKLVDDFKAENKDTPNPDRKQKIRELLNGIAYLFKNAEYQYEHELRLVVKGIGLTKEVEDKDPKGNPIPLPRVFINLVSIIPAISHITIGPKVANKEEWASIFHYHLKNQGHEPEIHISYLPFK